MDLPWTVTQATAKPTPPSIADKLRAEKDYGLKKELANWKITPGEIKRHEDKKQVPKSWSEFWDGVDSPYDKDNKRTNIADKVAAQKSQEEKERMEVTADKPQVPNKSISQMQEVETRYELDKRVRQRSGFLSNAKEKQGKLGIPDSINIGNMFSLALTVGLEKAIQKGLLTKTTANTLGVLTAPVGDLISPSILNKGHDSKVWQMNMARKGLLDLFDTEEEGLQRRLNGELDAHKITNQQ